MSNVKTTDRKQVNEYLSNFGCRLADLDKLTMKGTGEEVPSSGTVEYRLLHTKKNRENNYTFPGVSWDLESGLAYGIPIRLKQEKDHVEVVWRRIPIQNFLLLDLSRQVDRQIHFVMYHSDLCQNGPNAGIAPKFKLHDSDAEARKKLEVKMKAKKADQIVDEIAAQGEAAVRDFSVLFGIDGRNSYPVTLVQLYERAANDPVAVLSRYQDPDRPLHVLVRTALSYGVLREGQSGIMHGGNPLGPKIEHVVKYLRDEKPGLAAVLEDEVANAKNPGAKPSGRGGGGISLESEFD